MAPVPSMPVFAVAGWQPQGGERRNYPCGCWEEIKQGYTVAYGRCEAHQDEVKPEAKVLQPKPKKSRKRRRRR